MNAPDLVVTFFAQAAIECPWPMHGRDISPLLAAPDSPDWNAPTLFEHLGQTYGADATAALASDKPPTHGGVPYYAAVRYGHYKYVRYLGADELDELYDLQADPEELENLSADPSHGPLRAQMHQMLLAELHRSGAEFATLAENKPAPGKR